MMKLNGKKLSYNIDENGVKKWDWVHQDGESETYVVNGKNVYCKWNTPGDQDVEIYIDDEYYDEITIEIDWEGGTYWDKTYSEKYVAEIEKVLNTIEKDTGV